MNLDKFDMKGHVIDSDLTTINFGSGIYNEDWDLDDGGSLKAKLSRASEGLVLNGIEWKYSLRMALHICSCEGHRVARFDCQIGVRAIAAAGYV
jgi:hypothetical protein